MTDTIKTKSVGKDFVKSNGILLEQTSDTALLFFPEIHPGGVRGHFIRFKKNRKQDWQRITEQDFRKLNLYEGVHIELGTKELAKLCEEIAKRQKIADTGVKFGETEYVVEEKNKVIVIGDQNIKEILEQILTQGYSDDFWDLLKTSNPSIVDKLTAGHLQYQRKQVVEILKERLQSSFPETSGPHSWQKWIYTHNWLFGPNYQPPIEKQKINITGVMPDYLFPTLDGFVDILEIKLPSMEVIEEDKSHPGSWLWAKDANQAIGQVVNYLCEIDRLRLELEKNIERNYKREISMLKPRAFILIGQQKDWNKDKKEGLRKLNHSLHGIEVLTYSDLVQRGESFVVKPPRFV